MVDTLRTLSEVIANLPDNTTQLISPQDIREAIYCITPDRANASGEGGPWAVPFTGTDWADLGPIVMPVMDENLWWEVDANGAIRPAYPAGITIPPGHLRTAQLTGLIAFDPAFNTPAEFTFAVAGAPVGDVVSVDAGTQISDVQAGLVHDEDLDYSDPLQAVTVWARNPAGGGSLSITQYELRATGAPND